MFQKTTWNLNLETYNIAIHKIPNSFDEKNYTTEGNSQKGMIHFHSIEIKDEVWGPSSKLLVEWDEENPVAFHHGVEVAKSIDMYAAINVVINKKEQLWHLSHELTIWFGKRTKFEQRRLIPILIIHGLFMCDQTNRVFQIHAEILESEFHKYEQNILEFIKSIQCHDV